MRRFGSLGRQIGDIAMHIDATPAEAHTILEAMLAVAAAGPAVTAADRTSVLAAARYIFKIELSPDLAGLMPPRPDALAALAAKPDLATEAARFATVMAFVDGTLDNGKLNAVLRLAATLGVKADFVRDIANVAQGRLRDATAHMIRANLESLTGKAWTAKPWATDDDAMGWFLPYKGANADPALAARFHALAELPGETFGHAFATFYLSQKYAFPGEERSISISRRPMTHRICSRATIRRRAGSCWCRHSRRLCTATRPCPATSCRCFSAGISVLRSTRLPAPPKARSIRRNSGTPGRAARR
jgi:hypothetical protein